MNNSGKIIAGFLLLLFIVAPVRAAWTNISIMDVSIYANYYHGGSQAFYYGNQSFAVTGSVNNLTFAYWVSCDAFDVAPCTGIFGFWVKSGCNSSWELTYGNNATVLSTCYAEDYNVSDYSEWLYCRFPENFTLTGDGSYGQFRMKMNGTATYCLGNQRDYFSTVDPYAGGQLRNFTNRDISPVYFYSAQYLDATFSSGSLPDDYSTYWINITTGGTCTSSLGVSWGGIYSDFSGLWEPAFMNPEIENGIYFDGIVGNLPIGTWKQAVFCNDTNGRVVFSENRTFHILNGTPTATVLDPAEGKDFQFTTPQEEIILTGVCEGAGFPQAWGGFYSNRTGVWDLDCIGEPTNATNFTCGINFPEGVFKWGLFCNDTIHPVVFSENRTFIAHGPPFDLLFDTVGGGSPFNFHHDENSCIFAIGNGVTTQGCFSVSKISFPFLGNTSQAGKNCTAIIMHTASDWSAGPLPYPNGPAYGINSTSVWVVSDLEEDPTNETNFTFPNYFFVPYQDPDFIGYPYTPTENIVFLLNCTISEEIWPDPPHYEKIGIRNPVYFGSNAIGRDYYIINNYESGIVDDSSARVLVWGQRWGDTPSPCCGYIRARGSYKEDLGKEYAGMGDEVGGFICASGGSVTTTVISVVVVVFAVFTVGLLVHLAGG